MFSLSRLLSFAGDREREGIFSGDRDRCLGRKGMVSISGTLAFSGDREHDGIFTKSMSESKSLSLSSAPPRIAAICDMCHLSSSKLNDGRGIVTGSSVVISKTNPEGITCPHSIWKSIIIGTFSCSLGPSVNPLCRSGYGCDSVGVGEFEILLARERNAYR